MTNEDCSRHGRGKRNGATAARRLAQDGHKVAILSSSGKGERLAKELGGIGVTGSNQLNDDLKRFVDQVMGAWGRVDVLVNSAGHGPRDQILKITDEQWHSGLDTYLLNVIRPSQLVAPIMAQQRGGAIINISTANVPHLGCLPCRACRFREDICRSVCGRQRAHEQRASRLDR